MAYTPTTNLSLPIITTGTESGTWGDVVDNGLTAYLDIAIAGKLAVTITTTDVTLASTAGTNAGTGITSTTGQYACVVVSGAKTAARNLILPTTNSAGSAINGKSYIIINSGTSTGGPFALTVKGSATTGVTLVDGEECIVAWNGSDFVKVSSSVLTALTGTLPVLNGGTGTTTPALVAGTNVTISGTWPNQTINASGGGSGSVTSVGLSAPAIFTVTGSPVTTTGTLALAYSGTALPIANGGTNSTATPTAGGAGYGTGTAHAYTAAGTSGNALISAGAGAPAFGNLALGTANTNVSGALTVTNGGTGLSTLTANNVILGNGASNPTFVAPGTSGNILTSNGTTWTSAAAPTSGVTGGKTLFTSSGTGQTFTVPTGVTAVKVTVIAGGGSGGAQFTSGCNNAGGGGGGGGGTAIKWLTGLTPGGTLTVTVGAAGGASSVASGTSNTITTVSATAGSNGNTPVSNTFSSGGAGGIGSSGDLNIGGSGGGFGSGYSSGTGGSGGSSILGGGGSSGAAGRAYGGGGGGNSGAGASGLVMFEY